MGLTLNTGSGGATLKTYTVSSEEIQAISINTPLGDSVFDDTNDAIKVVQSSASLFNATIGAALPAGTNAIGKLAANSGVDIGDVDVLSVIPGAGATNLGKAEDAVHSTGDTGVMSLSVRQDTAAATSGADGDYQPLITDANGRLHVIDVSTLAALSGNEFQVDVVAALPSGTNAIGKLAANSGVDIGDVDVLTCGAITPGTAASNLGKAEDAAHTTGDVGVMPLSVRQDSASALSGTDGDYQPLITDANGRLHVIDVSALAALSGSEFQVDVVAALPAGTNAIGKLAANSGVDIGDVDVLSVIPGAGATNLGKAEDAVHTSGDIGVMSLAVRNDALAALAGTDGDYAPLQVDDRGSLYVAIPNRVSTNNSTTATLGVGATFTGVGDDVSNCGSVTVQLDSSHDSSASGMTMQFSIDNTNWDDVYTWNYTAADGARRFQYPVTAQYFRVVYTNGGTEQTHLRVQTILHAETVSTSIHRLVDDTDPDRSATLVKAVVVAQAAGSGDFKTINSTAGGNLKVAVEEFAESLPAGTNTIGKLAANSGVDIGDVDVTSVIPGTGATNLGKAQDTAVGATDSGVAILFKRDDEQATVTPVDGDYVVPTVDRFGKVKVTNLPDATSEIKYGVINASFSGDNTLQAAAGAGVKIRVLSAFIMSDGTVDARFESGASGTALTGQEPLIVNSGFVLPFNPGGWFETADNALLNLELSAAIGVHGSFSYVEV